MTVAEKEMRITGRIADIQRFSLHDGPGIRTTVFVKGCNLHCAWCHNPETISFEKDVIVDFEKCIHCGKCDEGCFSGARRIVGEDLSVADVMKIVLEDRPYYGSEGGLTVTGGEPCLQPEFTKALFCSARSEKIHTAIETNLAVSKETLRDVVSCCDLVMCDLKMLNSELHRKYTGMGNEKILDNLCFLDTLEIPIVVRTPIMTGVNDDADSMEDISLFLKKIRNLRLYELLPYHKLGLAKHVEGMEAQEAYETPSAERMLELARIACGHLNDVAIRGKRVYKE